MYFAVDLQKVTSVPIMPSMKEVFFTSAITVFNETFGALQPDKMNARDDVCVMWDETIQKREGNDIASTFSGLCWTILKRRSSHSGATTAQRKTRTGFCSPPFHCFNGTILRLKISRSNIFTRGTQRTGAIQSMEESSRKFVGGMWSQTLASTRKSSFHQANHWRWVLKSL